MGLALDLIEKSDHNAPDRFKIPLKIPNTVEPYAVQFNKTFCVGYAPQKLLIVERSQQYRIMLEIA